MFTHDFDYSLPEHLIAQTPLEPRDSARLMVLNRTSGIVQHQTFNDLPNYLVKGDLLVFNNTRVIPARLRGVCQGTLRRVELLLVERVEPGVWKSIGKPSRHLKPGTRIIIESPHTMTTADVIEALPDGIRLIRISHEDVIDMIGEIPLPPYIRAPLVDIERYQTIYGTQTGSVAAPTAGLHFTEQLMHRLTQSGIELAFVTLHVGLDTFRPIHEEDPLLHKMHGEYYELETGTINQINNAVRQNRRIVAVGTTTTRVLEHLSPVLTDSSEPTKVGISGWTDLYILPGHHFRVVNGIITNFHLPRTTLLMMVSAFTQRDLLLNAYQEAINMEYRFYSFGDAMILI